MTRWLLLGTLVGCPSPTPGPSETQGPSGTLAISPDPLRPGDVPSCAFGPVLPGIDVGPAAWSVNGEPVGTGAWPGVRLQTHDEVRCQRTLSSSSRTLTVEASTTVAPANVLVIVTDDHGVDWVNAYGETTAEVHTPNIDALAARGMLFRRAWAYPTCSPTRASLHTGRHPFRYDLGFAIPGWEAYYVPDEEVMIPEVLRDYSDAGFTSALIGKWHLGMFEFAGADQPLRQGYDHHLGSFTTVFNYWAWNKNVDGEMVWTETYATQDTLQDIEAVLPDLPEPWFVMLTLNVPHNPFHVPPAELGLHTYTLSDTPTDVEMYAAMVESADTVVGRTLDVLPPAVLGHTHVLFMGDNGTPNGQQAPIEVPGGKASVRETGVRVPFIVAGPAVDGPAETEAMVQTVDLLPTIAELSGITLPTEVSAALDGESFAAVLADPTAAGRSFMYVDQFRENGPGPYDLLHRAVRDDRYKLIEINGTRSLYDMQGVRREGAAIPTPYTGDALTAYQGLSAILDTHGPTSD